MSRAEHRTGPGGQKLSMNTPELVDLIGEVEHTLGDSGGTFGLCVKLDSHAKWIVTKPCYLRGLDIAEGASITSVGSSNIQMYVDGVLTEIRTGSYKGQISLHPILKTPRF